MKPPCCIIQHTKGCELPEVWEKVNLKFTNRTKIAAKTEKQGERQFVPEAALTFGFKYATLIDKYMKNLFSKTFFPARDARGRGQGVSMRKTMKKAVYILLLLIMSISTVILAYLHFFAANDNDLSGEWTADLDMTGRAAVTALNWLQDIEAVSVSLEDMESCMQGLTIQVNLTLEQTARSEGTFHSSVLTESYDACNQAAYEAFAMAFRELLAERLRMAGYTGGTDEEAVEALVTENFGMSTVSYLMSFGPALLPPLEELQAQYDGSGAYETAEGILTRQFDTGGSAATKTECYIRKDSKLILSEETGSVSYGFFSGHYPLIYTLDEMK